MKPHFPKKVTQEFLLVDLVNNLDKKVSLLTQKIVIATVLIGGAFQLLGIWYTAHLSNQYSEKEKISYYEKRIQESEVVEALEKEIEMLKAGKKLKQ